MDKIRRDESFAALLVDYDYKQLKCGEETESLDSLWEADDALSKKLNEDKCLDLWVDVTSADAYVTRRTARGVAAAVTRLWRITGVSREGPYVIWGVSQPAGRFSVLVTLGGEREENAKWYTVEAFRRLKPSELKRGGP